MLEGEARELFQLIRSKLPEDIQDLLEDLQASSMEHSLDEPLLGRLHLLAEKLQGLPIKGSLQGRLPPGQVNTFKLLFPYQLEKMMQTLERAASQQLVFSTLERTVILSLMDLAFCVGHDYVTKHGPLLEPLEED